jgi:hypothetical protein
LDEQCSSQDIAFLHMETEDPVTVKNIITKEVYRVDSAEYQDTWNHFVCLNCNNSEKLSCFEKIDRFLFMHCERCKAELPYKEESWSMFDKELIIRCYKCHKKRYFKLIETNKFHEFTCDIEEYYNEKRTINRNLNLYGKDVKFISDIVFLPEETVHDILEGNI